jgi:threonine aldolase
MTVIAAPCVPTRRSSQRIPATSAFTKRVAVEATGLSSRYPEPRRQDYGEQAAAVVDAHWNDQTHEHQAQPALVYLSQPTENGTIYSREELKKISGVCRERGLLLFVDGARLGAALVAPGNDVFLPDLAELCDAFYIGGTKLGALFGEAVVLTNEALKKDFRYIKQRGVCSPRGVSWAFSSKC